MWIFIKLQCEIMMIKKSIEIIIVLQDLNSQFDWLIGVPSKAVWTSQKPHGPQI